MNNNTIREINKHFLLALILSCWFLTFSTGCDLFEVSFSDPQLENCIREEIKIFDDRKLTRGDLSSLISLDLSEKNISSLSGLEEARSLESLKLRGNNITDISPLSKLKKLWK